MPEATPPHLTLKLQGPWTAIEAVERWQLLTEGLRQLESPHGPATASVDLAQITAIDACGCQLLAAFLGYLKGRVTVPEACGLAPDIRDQIALLGFADVLAASGAAGKETI